MMLTRRIPRSGEEIPVIGLGTWKAFDVGPSQAERAPLEDVLKTFVELGGRVVDTSPMYNRSEQVAGEIIQKLKLRRKLFIATKVWTTGEEEGIAQMKDSMWKLHADPVDLLQVHNLVNEDTHLDTLDAWKRDGHVRYTGITHYQASSHGALCDVMRSRPVDFVQVNYSVEEREAENTVLPLAQELGLAVLVNRPFGGGEQLARVRNKPLPGFAADLGCSTWPQLLLKFIISHPAVTCVIPATSKAQHLRDNVAAGAGPMPDEKQRGLIAAEFA